jgi:hypothetical protein
MKLQRRLALLRNDDWVPFLDHMDSVQVYVVWTLIIIADRVCIFVIDNVTVVTLENLACFTQHNTECWKCYVEMAKNFRIGEVSIF